MTTTHTYLSGAPDSKGSAISGVGSLASKTTVHTGHATKAHTVWLVISNTNGSTSAIVKGDVGASTNQLYWDIPANSFVLYGPVTIVNTTIKIGSDDADAADINVAGAVMQED